MSEIKTKIRTYNDVIDLFGEEIVGYNIAFDIGFLKAAGATINPDAVIIDTMQEFMDAFGNSRHPRLPCRTEMRRRP